MATDNDNENLAKRVDDLHKMLTATQASHDAAKARVDDLERRFGDYVTNHAHDVGTGGRPQLVTDEQPPLFAEMVRGIFNGAIAWPVESHEVVDGIGTARVETAIHGVPVKLTRVVHKSTGRAGYVAIRPDGERLVFHVATPGGRMLAAHELDDHELVLSERQTLDGYEAREARDEAKRRETEAQVAAELQRRSARP